MHQGGGRGYQEILSKIFCLTVPKISVGGNLLSVSIISGIEKVWMRGGEYQDFPWKIFCLTVPKCFTGEQFGVSEKFFYRKLSCIGGEGHHRFVGIFCLT